MKKKAYFKARAFRGAKLADKGKLEALTKVPLDSSGIEMEVPLSDAISLIKMGVINPFLPMDSTPCALQLIRFAVKHPELEIGFHGYIHVYREEWILGHFDGVTLYCYPETTCLQKRSFVVYYANCDQFCYGNGSITAWWD